MKATRIFSGQHHPYGDSHTIYLIETDATMEEAEAWARKHLANGIPSHREYVEETTYGGAHYGDYGYYFGGYYTISRDRKGYRFDITFPWAD